MSDEPEPPRPNTLFRPPTQRPPGGLRDARNRSGEESEKIPPPVARGIAVTQNAPMIWTCAAERIGYLENVLGAN